MDGVADHVIFNLSNETKVLVLGIIVSKYSFSSYSDTNLVW